MSNDALFENTNIAPIYLTTWLDWCSGNSNEQQVVMPMIQRGSVWKPAQIIDLWDSLLRGFPVGSLMLNRIQADGKTLVRLPGESKSSVLKKEAFGLLDGQQRTLTMLIGWPSRKVEMDRRIWVDFADAPSSEHHFRLRVTTENHPFGFQRSNPSRKLPMDERRRALIIYRKQQPEASESFPDYQKAYPYHAGDSLPVDIAILLKFFQEKDGFAAWKDAVNRELNCIPRHFLERNPESNLLEAFSIEDEVTSTLINSEPVQKCLSVFYDALTRFYKLQAPLLLVDMQSVEAANKDEDNDPALAILFKRVGSNGTPLSMGDYMFSVIKHHCPETHDLVEKIHTPSESVRDYNIAALLNPTDIVATAVRLAAAGCVDEKDNQLADYETIEKKQFHRILNHQVKVHDKEGDFLKVAFLPLLQQEHELGLPSLFKRLANILAYRKDVYADIGLPAHALILLKRPLIQVLLYWLYKCDLNKESLEESRAELIRFVMVWSLCVTDPPKVSSLAYQKIRKSETNIASLFRAIYEDAVEKGYALKLFSPATLERLIGSVVRSPAHVEHEFTLRGWSRFTPEVDEPDEKKKARELYRKWWRGDGENQYSHAILLWVQRAYVAELSGSPVAGRDEDTPYDFDHILPSSNWNNWRGKGNNKQIIDFMLKGDRHYWLVGNCIGNVRVWSSSDNRSDGDDSPQIKLHRDGDDGAFINSAISTQHKQLWDDCSAQRIEEKRIWSTIRAQAFQRAVEERVFYLYGRFCDDLEIDLWVK